MLLITYRIGLCKALLMPLSPWHSQLKALSSRLKSTRLATMQSSGNARPRCKAKGAGTGSTEDDILPYKALTGPYNALKGPYKALKGPYKAHQDEVLFGDCNFNGCQHVPKSGQGIWEFLICFQVRGALGEGQVLSPPLPPKNTPKAKENPSKTINHEVSQHLPFR